VKQTWKNVRAIL